MPGAILMPIELTCRTCGQPYVPSREDLARGSEVYRHCPACRPVGVAGENTEVRA
jgi:hypothetical protein